MKINKFKFGPLFLSTLIAMNSLFSFAANEKFDAAAVADDVDKSLEALQQYCEDIYKYPSNYQGSLKDQTVKSIPFKDAKGKVKHDIFIKVNYEGTDNYISCHKNFHTKLLASSLADLSKKKSTDKASCDDCTEIKKDKNQNEIALLANSLKDVNKESSKLMCEGTKKKDLKQCASDLTYCGLENLKLTKVVNLKKPTDLKCNGLLKGAVKGNKDIGDCMATFIRGAFDEVVGTLKFLAVDAPKWLYAKTFGNWFKEPAVNQMENVSSLEAIAATKASDKAIKKEQKDPAQSFATRIKKFAENLILQKGSEAFGCEKWSGGVAGIGKCISPPASWECASCKQKAMTLCGVTGFVAGAVVETAILAVPVGVVAGTTVGLMSVASKGAKGAKAATAVKSATVANKAASAIVKGSVAVGNAGLKVLKPIAKGGYAVGKKTIEALSLVPGVSLTAKVVTAPIRGALKADDFLTSKAWNLTYHGSKAYTQALAKTGDVALAVEAAKTAAKLAQVEKAGSSLLVSQGELATVSEKLKTPNLSAMDRKVAENKKVKLLVSIDKKKAKFDKLKSNISHAELNNVQRLPSAHTTQLAGKYAATEQKVALKSDELKEEGLVLKADEDLKPVTLKDIKAQDIAKLVAVDEESAKLLSDPAIAQYIYVNHFLDDATDNETRLVLQEIVDSATAGDKDLYTLVNKTLVNKLNDPAVKAKVAAAFKGEENILRPSKFDSKMFPLKAKLRQILNMPETLSRIKKNTYEGFDQEVMDRGLFDFYGATQLGLKESQLRQWDVIPGGFEAIRPNQVENMSPDLWAKLAMFASETEAPIHGYSTNSGEALRGLFPSVSAFMGKNEDQYKAYETALEAFNAGKREDDVGPFCSNVWCSEEKRHEIAVKNIGEHVTAKIKTEPSTYEADKMGDFSDAEYAMKHLVGRNSSEWNANSIYLYLRSHSTGPANKWVDNIRKDETKHMAIFASAWKHIFGNQPGKRTEGMIEKIRQLKAVASETNSSGDVLSGDMTTLFEVGVTHLFVEKKVRDFIKSVPLKTMDKIFDSPVKTLKEIESIPLTAQKEKAILEMNEREAKNRAKLARWSPKEREKYLALKAVEKEHADLIESLIANLFNGFRGAETPNSAEMKAVLKQIDKLRTGLDNKTNALIQLSLKETLRDYQIMNNKFVQNNPNLKVRLKSASEGFVVEHKGPGEAEVLLAKPETDTTFKLRVKRPADLELKPGQAMKIEIPTANGPDWRVLSLASSSSPKKDYIEFAVGTSDSDFKQAFVKLKPGQTVTVSKAKGSMDFDPDSPAVMIAGGIGITPFRSMIDYVRDEKLSTPMYLYYANRNQVPFGDEFTKIAEETPQLDLNTILSKPDADWKGKTGRIDEPFLKNEVPRLPKNSKYYIVGPTPMVTGTKQALMNLGVKEENIHIEIFATSAAPAQASAGESKVIPIKNQSKDKTVCRCQSVSASTINAAIDAGANTVDAIAQKTMATTGCGECKCDVEKMIQCRILPAGK